MELTKKFETHYRGPVGEVRRDLEDKIEGSKMKGEVTLVVAPCEDQEEYMAEVAKGTGFDPKRDSKVTINIIEVARALNAQVEMGESEFRGLMKAVFPNVPSYHLAAIVRIIRKNGKESRHERLARIVGGMI